MNYSSPSLEDKVEGMPYDHLNWAQAYTHAPMLGTYVAVWVMVYHIQMSWEDPWFPTLLLGSLGVLAIVGTSLSIAYHREQEDGIVDNGKLARAELALNITVFIAGLVALVTAWIRAGSWKAPFQANPMFAYLVGGAAFTIVAMASFFSASSVFHRSHTQYLKDNCHHPSCDGDPDPDAPVKTERFLLYNLYHTFWHMWAGVFFFLALCILYLLLRIRHFKR